MLDRITKIKICIISLLCVANFFVWYAVSHEDRQGFLTVSFLNVGQGDAIFIDAPNGNQILLDGGPNKSVLREIGSVMPFYDRSIDLLALSHPHTDHLAGLLDVFPRYSVSGLISSGMGVKTPEYISLRNYFEALSVRQVGSGIQEVVAMRGMKIDLGEGVIIDVLFPSAEVASSTPHDGMMVLKLNYGKTSFLFTGDMEKSLENKLISFYGNSLKSNVLKIGHHGSKNSTNDNFLQYVSPEYAVVSVGANNKYGHPAEETIKSLDEFGVQTLRTDKDGNITIKSDGDNLYLDK